MSGALRLLLIDDSPAERELVSEACVEFAPDIELLLAGNTAEALAAIAGGPTPLLALVDLNLGDVNGCDLIARLAIPVAIMTTTDDPVERDRCLAAGAVEFLVKPLRFDAYPQLFGRIRALAGALRS